MNARIRRLPVILFVAVVLGALGFTGCNDDDLETIEAALVAPPGVPPRQNRPAAHVVVHLEAREDVEEIAPGVEYRVWSFNGSVPGPLIRVHVGDSVEIRLRNRSDSTTLHNIDLHAVNGPGGGADATNVAPGEEKAFTFKAKAPGLFVYHCAAGIVSDHIANGMYGGILVDGTSARQSVDREYYIGQHEYYLTNEPSSEGLSSLDSSKLLAEDPTFVVFNGGTRAVVEDDALRAETDDTVRLYVANGGPNFTSAFHVIGEIFDRVYEYGSTSNLPLEDVQTVLVPPGGAAIVDFRVEVPGDYRLVDHALARVAKGGLGILTVSGEDDLGTFRDLGAVTPEPTPATTEVTGPTATREAQPTATSVPPGGNGDDSAIAVDMDDNFFAPDSITVQAGTEVTFELTNVGALPHNMHIATASGSYDDGVISVPDLIFADASGELTWQAPDEPGTYQFRCDVHPVEMTGTIVVEG